MPDPRAVQQVMDDLRAETAELDAVVGPLPREAWRTGTPAAGWTIAHQIAHLAWTDEQALLSATEPEVFTDRARAAVASGDSLTEESAARGAALPPAELLARWREGRERLWTALAAVPPQTRFPWFGPPMGVAAMGTARLMETWAHGQDVVDAVGVRRGPTVRLRHIARIGVRTRDFAFSVHGAEPPATEFHVELTLPDGSLWSSGPKDAEQRVTGQALDFCLLVTQRRHRADLALAAYGADADRWLDIAQAFAGPPGGGRRPAGDTRS